jgi:hypothetical protein
LSAWGELRRELAEWRTAGRSAELWWRDDDAASLTVPLERLLALSRASGVPLALAMIPESAHSDAISRAECILMHGCDHRNRASAGEKKTEFPAAEDDEAALARLAAARAHLALLAGGRFIPVLAPPWNRLRDALIGRLPEAGLHGLSRYGARGAPRKGVREVNTHVDIIAWRGDRGFAGEQAVLASLVRHLEARRRGEADAGEATGLLTHHALHDGAAWQFLARLFDETRAGGAVWRGARELFPAPA